MYCTCTEHVVFACILQDKKLGGLLYGRRFSKIKIWEAVYMEGFLGVFH